MGFLAEPRRKLNRRVKMAQYRRAVARNARDGLGAVPDFIVIGVQKGGTTSLFHYLRKHPQVLASLKKEVNFFDQFYPRGIDWYKGNFPVPQEPAASDAGSYLTGEASPNYLINPHVAGRIAAHCPDAKLLLLLRDPVRRTYSQYQHMVRMGLEKLSFEEALAAEEGRIRPHWDRMMADPAHESDTYRRHSYKARSRYAEQLEWWFDAIPRDRFLIMQSERFFRETQDCLDEVHRFLGLDAWAHPDLKPYNQHGYPGIEPKVRDELIDYFQPHNEALFKLLGQRYDDWGVV